MSFKNKQVYSVLVPLNIKNSNCEFDYLSKEKLKIGTAVKVSVGNKSIVWGIVKNKKDFDIKIKYKSILSAKKNIILNSQLIDFISWVAEWTMYSPGSILKLILSDKDLIKDEEKITEGYIKSNVFEFNTFKKKIELTNDQEIAANKLISLTSRKSYTPILLDGITGSGKTEVYFETIKNQLKLKKSCLILLPEIFLSQEWKVRFKEYFGFEPIEWHSQLSKKKRRENWFYVYHNSPTVIVGARSALFLPIKELGLIIIDEEHDHSYKQEEQVRYHARDMALYRAKLFKIPIILSSATPSLETWNNVKNNNFDSVKLTKRIGGVNLPEIKLIDMKESKVDSGKWISQILLDKINENKLKNQLSLLYLNRRGYAPIKLCNNCGEKIGCPNCQSWLVEHKSSNRLLCHQCSFSKKITTNCPQCNENSLISFGPGVERINEEIKTHFPSLQTVILSSDTIKNIKVFKEILKKINKNQIDLIIGTQIISKGYNFKNLTLVGVIDADLGLSGGDLRATEKTFQMLHQVSGRAGRENIDGHVYIQTYNPENLVINSLQKNNRNDFLSIEMSSREALKMPPFGKLASIILSSKNEVLLKKVSLEILGFYKSFNDIELYGPAPAQIYLIRGRYRMRFLLKTSKKVNIQKVIKNWLSEINIPSSINMNIDIDPYSFL